jgi:hypothetical protein
MTGEVFRYENEYNSVCRGVEHEYLRCLSKGLVLCIIHLTHRRSEPKLGAIYD